MGEPGNTAFNAIGARRFWVGLLALGIGGAAAGVLAAEALHLLTPPGCGEGSPCERAAASAFGRVPLVGWPTSFVGLAWFASLAAAWIAARAAGAIPGALRLLVRLGAAVSVALLVAMIAGRYVCPYCVAVHVGNFIFLFAVEGLPRRAAPVGKSLGWFAAAFVVMTGVEAAARYAAQAPARREAEEATRRIAEGANRGGGTQAVPGTSPGAAPGAAVPGAVPGATPPAPVAAGTTAPPDSSADDAPFTGRYLKGPAHAPLRVVIFADFQCPECRGVEMELRKIMATRNDVSLSMKHFPFHKDCNPIVKGTLHGNACWAARAAEAAGILHGNEGFWQMHDWLFDRKGAFTDAELKAALAGFGYDAAEFLKTMTSDEVRQNIESDSREADRLGLHVTPLVYVNGVEFRSWFIENKLTEAITTLGSKNLPPGDPSQDHPPLAAQKYVDDWRFQPAVTVPPDAHSWFLGSAEAPLKIVFWGDYQEPFCAEADAFLRRVVAGRSDVRYAFRHYPICGACNPATPPEAANMHPLACRMAEAAEAAGALGGNDAYWKMHEWLMANQKTFSDETLSAAAKDMGLDPAALFATMTSPDVAAEIASDAQAAKRVGIRSVPFVLINDKLLPRWKMQGVIEAIIEEAGGEKVESRK